MILVPWIISGGNVGNSMLYSWEDVRAAIGSQFARWFPLVVCAPRFFFMIVERSFSTILFYDRWTIVFPIFFPIVERSFWRILFYDRWTILFNDPFLWSLNDRFHRSFSMIDERFFSTILFYDRWTIVLTVCFPIVERSFSTILFYDSWTILSNDPFLWSLNECFEVSFSMIVERSFSTIGFLWSFNGPFFRPLNDSFQRSVFPIVERSFSTIRFHDCWTIFLNDFFLWSLNDRFNDLFSWSSNDRFEGSFFMIVERSFSTMLFYDRWTIVLTIVFSDRFRSLWRILFYDRWTILFNDPFLWSLNDRFEGSFSCLFFPTLYVTHHTSSDTLTSHAM